MDCFQRYVLSCIRDAHLPLANHIIYCLMLAAITLDEDRDLMQARSAIDDHREEVRERDYYTEQDEEEINEFLGPFERLATILEEEIAEVR